MKKIIKKIIDLILLKLNYKIISVKSTISNNNLDCIIKFLIKKKPIMFDIGANTGQSIERFFKIRKNALIHSFECSPKIFNILEKKYAKGKIFLNKYAVGSKKKKINFYTFKDSRIASLLKIDKKSKFYKGRIINTNSNYKNFSEKILVNQITIDQYARINNIKKIDLLKIDTQGTSDEVLIGAKRLLKKQKISIIQLELILGFAYSKVNSFFDIEKILNKYNYKLIYIQNAGNIISFSNFQTDLLYVNLKIFNYIKSLHIKNIKIKDVMNSTNKKHPESY
jgi:FkbM family methyltransferase